MTRFPLIILALVALLVTVVTGCGGMRRHDARLAAADSLMQSDPDSALAIVEAVCRDSLATEGDRAYRDLLLTQARYRCYIPATSDSDISRALAWYRVHDGEREKLTRALIYKGAVMEELSRPDSAMLYYKQAEATADEKDYANLGQINLRIADLYRKYFVNTEICFEKFGTALKYFELTDNKPLQQNCLYNMAGCLGITAQGDPRKYLNKATELAVELNDSLQMFNCQELLARQLAANDSTRQDAKLIAMESLEKYPNYVNVDLLLDLAFIYAKERNLDSAEYYLKIINNYSSDDHIGQVKTRMHSILAIIADYANDPAISKYHIQQNKWYSDSIANNKNRYRIQHIENVNNSTQRTLIKQKNKILISVIVSIALIFLALAFFLSYLHNRRAIAYQRDLDMARAEIEKTIGEYEDRISEIESSLDKQRLLLDEKDKTIKKVAKENDKLISRQTEINRQISRIVRKRLAAINEIYSDIRLRTADNTAYKQSVPLISLIKGWNEKKQLYMITPKESFWKDLHQSIDDEYHGLASFVKNKYSLTVREFQLFLLLSAKISPQIIKLFMDFSNPTTVSNYKRKLMKNLTGHEMKLEDFIQDYLDGKLN